MVDLKKEVNEYLLSKNQQKNSLNLQIPEIKTLKVLGWLRKEPKDESWLQDTKKEYCQSLSKCQRLAFFALSIGLGLLCFSLSLIYIPVLLFKARKFALLFTMGSIFFVCSFFFLWGPVALAKRMFSKDKILLVTTYGGSLVATLYCALHLQSTPLTVLFASCQIISLFWTVIVNIPGGTSGISLMSGLFTRSSGNLLPV